MGNFYVNYTVKASDQELVATVLSGRTAFVTRPVGGCVVVVDQESDAQDQRQIKKLGAFISKALGCPVLAVLNHDDDIFWYCLFNHGQVIDTYDSSPGYFDDSAEPSGPLGGDAEKLCSAFDSQEVDEVQEILQRSSFDDDGYAFAYQRHEDLFSELELPSFSVCLCYQYVVKGDFPDGLKEHDLLSVS